MEGWTDENPCVYYRISFPSRPALETINSSNLTIIRPSQSDTSKTVQMKKTNYVFSSDKVVHFTTGLFMKLKGQWKSNTIVLRE